MLAATLRELEVRYAEYEQLMLQGEYYAAFLRLSEVSASLGEIDPSSKATWEERILALNFSKEALQEVQRDAKLKAQRVVRILSIGSRWDEDEILLVMTIRVQLDLLYAFFNMVLRQNLEVSLQELDLHISRVTESPTYNHVFKKVIQQMKKNWGLPINTEIFGVSYL